MAAITFCNPQGTDHITQRCEREARNFYTLRGPQLETGNPVGYLNGDPEKRWVIRMLRQCRQRARRLHLFGIIVYDGSR